VGDGGFTGSQIFTFDGKFARFLITNAGAENGTTFDRNLLGAMLGESLETHERFCK
jgi:hypothetical protein